MSTYTDLHNKIKENITVGYSPDDRITTQQVRFYNTKNEYWGTFHGDFSAEKINADGGVLKNITLVDSYLSNVSYPNGVNFDEFGYKLKTLSTEVVNILDQKLPTIHGMIDSEALTRQNSDDNLHELIMTTDVRLSSFTKEIKQNLEHMIELTAHQLTDQDRAISTILVHQDRSISTYLNNELTSLSVDTNRHFDSLEADLQAISTDLSTAISAEEIARIENDAYLSDELSTLRYDFGEEIKDRTYADTQLFNKISTETYDRIVEDTSLSNAIDSLHSSTTLSLDTMDAEHKALLEHDRHYVIKNQIGNGALPSEYPYPVDDYTVNLFELGNIAGRVFWNDDSGNRIEIGRVVQTDPNPSSPYPIELLPLNDIKSNQILSAFDPNLTYRYTEDTSSHRAGDNRAYELLFDTSLYSINPQLSSCSFILKPISEKFRQVTVDGLGVGYVRAAFPEGESSDVLSGLLTLDTAGSTEFDAFKYYNNITFVKDDPELSSKSFPNATKVTYLGNNHFKLEKNIVARNYLPLKNVYNPDLTINQFGLIYQTDGAGHSTIVEEDGELKSVLVNLSEPYNKQTYKLEKAADGTFSTLIAEDENNKDNVYLTAEATRLSATFSIISYSKQYRYDLYGLDEDGNRQRIEDCYIVPEVYNKTFTEVGEDCEKIKVHIGNLLWLNVFKSQSPFTLEKVDDKLWTYECTDSEGESVLNIKYDGNTRKLRFKITALNGGQVVAQSYDINVNEYVEINSEPTIRCKTTQLDLSNFNDLIYESTSYTAVIDSRVSGNTDRSYKFEIDTADLDTIKLRIPERSTEDISREFIIAIKYVSNDTTFKKFKLVDDGSSPEVQLLNTTYGEPYLYVSPNRLAVYQVKEIDKRQFVAVDLNDEEDNYQIEQLHRKDDALSAEIYSLSVNLSTDIDSLSTRLSNDVDSLSTRLSTDVDSLSTRLSAEIDMLSSSISGTVDLSVETIEAQIAETNDNLNELSADVKGHLNYKGYIPLYVTESDGHIRPVESVPDFFANATYDRGERPFGTNTQAALKNGWVYKIVDVLNTGRSDRIAIPDGLITETYEDGDYVIVNIKSLDPAIEYVKVEDLRPCDLEVIDAVDHQDIAFLSSSIDTLSSSISAEVISLSTHLSNDIDSLSARLSGDVDSLSNRLSSEIDTLSSKLSGEIDLLSTSLSTTAEAKYFQLSGDNSVSGTNEFNSKLIAADMNVSATTVPALSTLYVEDVSKNVNEILELSVDNLTNEIVANDNDISFLSSTMDDLSADLSAEVDVLSADRNILSADLGNLSAHYFTNVSADIGLSYTYPVGGGTHTQPLSVDQLLIVDEVTFDRYRLTIRNGALNINKVDSVREA